MGAEISISFSRTLIGSFGPTLCLPVPNIPKTFFLVQFVAREYLLVGVTGSLMGELATLEAVWYDGRSDSRRSEVKMRNGLPDLIGVIGFGMYACASSGADGVLLVVMGVLWTATAP